MEVWIAWGERYHCGICIIVMGGLVSTNKQPDANGIEKAGTESAQDPSANAPPNKTDPPGLDLPKPYSRESNETDDAGEKVLRDKTKSPDLQIAKLSRVSGDELETLTPEVKFEITHPDVYEHFSKEFKDIFLNLKLPSAFKPIVVDAMVIHVKQPLDQPHMKWLEPFRKSLFKPKEKPVYINAKLKGLYSMKVRLNNMIQVAYRYRIIPYHA